MDPIKRLKAPAITDSRQAKTRQALHAALLTLLEEKPAEKLSIREISAAAGIGHATFYRHYSTKEALLNDLAADEIRQLVGLTLPQVEGADMSDAWLTFCHYVNDHRRLWKTLLTGGAAATIKEELLSISREIAASGDYNNRLEEGAWAELSVALTVSVMLETLAWWLRQDDPVAPEAVADILDRHIKVVTELQQK